MLMMLARRWQTTEMSSADPDDAGPAAANHWNADVLMLMMLALSWPITETQSKPLQRRPADAHDAGPLVENH